MHEVKESGHETVIDDEEKHCCKKSGTYDKRDLRIEEKKMAIYLY